MVNKDPGSSAGSRGVPSSSSTKMGVGGSSVILGALLSGGSLLSLGFSIVTVSRGYSVVAVRRLLNEVASLVAELGL